jgi:hypothetical protein
MGRQSTRRPYFRDSPLDELARNRPSNVMSRHFVSPCSRPSGRNL